MSGAVGKSIKRVEDPRFIQGKGKYVANLKIQEWPLPPLCAVPMPTPP
ncbi:MAG: hypothetical protein R2867_09860 [Caldilineaceae bacterium]